MFRGGLGVAMPLALMMGLGPAAATTIGGYAGVAYGSCDVNAQGDVIQGSILQVCRYGVVTESDASGDVVVPGHGCADDTNRLNCLTVLAVWHKEGCIPFPRVGGVTARCSTLVYADGRAHNWILPGSFTIRSTTSSGSNWCTWIIGGCYTYWPLEATTTIEPGEGEKCAVVTPVYTAGTLSVVPSVLMTAAEVERAASASVFGSNPNAADESYDGIMQQPEALFNSLAETAGVSIELGPFRQCWEWLEGEASPHPTTVLGMPLPQIEVPAP